MKRSKNYFIHFLLFTCLVLNTSNIFGQQQEQHHIELSWQSPRFVEISEHETITALFFSEAVYPFEDLTPVWFMLTDETSLPEDIIVTITPTKVSTLDQQSHGLASELPGITEDYAVEKHRSSVRKVTYTKIYVTPIRKVGTSYERLEAFDISVSYKHSGSDVLKPASPKSFRSASLLSGGTWTKIKVSESGIYKIGYQELSEMGLAGIPSSEIALYGMGGGMLPEKAGENRPDGLQEIPISVYDPDGTINSGDYISFYGESADEWKFDSINRRFSFVKNIYEDYNYYYITQSSNPGARIALQTAPSSPPSLTVTGFSDYAVHHNDSLNLIKSGKNWYGEEFDLKTSYRFDFSFPNPEPGANVRVNANVAARSISSSYFTISAGSANTTISIQSISATSYNSIYAYQSAKAFSTPLTQANLSVQVTYNKPQSSSVGWLDYLELNTRRTLTMTGNQMMFRNADTIAPGLVVSYQLQNANVSTVIWDISNPFHPEKVNATLSGTTLTFSSDASRLRQFVAFDINKGYSILNNEKITNQNLRGLSNIDYVILTHPKFITSARRLEKLHSTNNSLKTVILYPEQIYNEFSSGKQDPTAIRDFMKMLYDKATTPEALPKYLLLLGDGSYDNKNRIDKNTNYIPTYQSGESLHPVYSYVTDDYYGLLDDHEGVNGGGALDIGIGRFPVQTEEQAAQMTDKIERYMIGDNSLNNTGACNSSLGVKRMSDWRNRICLVADDEDGNLHLSDAEMLSKYIDTTHRVYNIHKIYLDAYLQESTPGGQRYPEANKAINDIVGRGTLIMNYTGHGGELGWAHERVLGVDDIKKWDNTNNMPLFVTATCEFTRFDDPERTSAGEYVFLNPDGGGIALFTTTRIAFSFSNFSFNNAFYKTVFKKVNDNYQRIGEIFRKSKVHSGSLASNRNVILIGDPALMLAYPQHNIVTTHINQKPVALQNDTLKALTKVEISGYIASDNGVMLSGYNGVLYPSVFDKKITYTTLGNDAGSSPWNFEIQKNILYKGKATIENGAFSFSFIVPKDIAYAFGKGKISYYAEDGETDGHGYYDNVIIGGSSNAAVTDQQGPVILLYLNDSTFVFGGVTDENPMIFAKVSDESGINTVGNGIGHDIIATLDEETDKQIVLNDYYEADMDSYQSGSIRYPLQNLENGLHTLSMKVWDVFNNSSEAYTEFIVESADEPVLKHVLNYPNPFTTYTEFWFEHNQACCDLDVLIQVFTVSGKLVKSIHANVQTTGYRADPVSWDGKDDFGDNLARGVYIYRVTIQNNEQKRAEEIQKLVILR